MPSPDIPLKLMTAAADPRDAGEVDVALDTVRAFLRSSAEGPYQSAKVRIVRQPDGRPQHLTVYLLRKDTYSAETVRLDVDEDYTVQAIVSNYDDSDEL